MCVGYKLSHCESYAEWSGRRKKATVADGAVNGALAFLPGVGVILTTAGKLKPMQQEPLPGDSRNTNRDCRIDKAARLAAIPFCLPALIFLAPLAPVGAVVGAVGAVGNQVGDLTEE